MVLTLLPTTAAAESNIVDTTSGLYTVSYNSGTTSGGYPLVAPTITGTENAPVLTFSRNETQSSGGVITSKYGMDFTRSFSIEGTVTFAERDGVSFALHTTAGKKSYSPNFNTCMMAPNLLEKWNKSSTSLTVNSTQNDITNGLLWDFMQYKSTSNAYKGTRFYAGAYSYQITNGTTVTALPDDAGKAAADGSDAAGGILHHGEKNTSGDFKLQWTCTDAASAVGKLTLTMGKDSSFTYTGLDAAAVFGGKTAAQNVYFSFST